MQSEIVLSNVIAKLDLNEKWGKKFNNGETFKTTDTMAILKDIMLLTPVRNTKLIAITVYSDDNKEAAEIANAVAESYRQYRLRNTATTGFDRFESAARSVRPGASRNIHGPVQCRRVAQKPRHC